MKDIQSTWAGLNRLAADDKDPMLRRIRRDGHCHEAVMWYVQGDSGGRIPRFVDLDLGTSPG